MMMSLPLLLNPHESLIWSINVCLVFPDDEFIQHTWYFHTNCQQLLILKLGLVINPGGNHEISHCTFEIPELMFPFAYLKD